MKVLFCTDGSKLSYQSIINFSKWAKDLTVDIFCSIDWSFLPDSLSIEDSEFALQCTNSADSILDYSEKYLNENGIITGEKIKLCGSTIDSILEISEKSNYDFIILGSHGKKGIQKWLGSVSQEIATVSMNSTFISKSANLTQKILFAIDGSDENEEMIKKCIANFDLSDKEIHIITVFEIPDYLFLDGNINSDWVLEITNKQENTSTLLLNKFDSIFNENNLKIYKKVVLNGTPSTEILKYITSNDIDLTVCGMRERKHLSRFLLSSVSKRILENSPSDVAIIKQL